MRIITWVDGSCNPCPFAQDNIDRSTVLLKILYEQHPTIQITTYNSDMPFQPRIDMTKC